MSEGWRFALSVVAFTLFGVGVSAILALLLRR